MSEKEKDTEASVSYVSLVSDPFGYKTLEVSEAQQQDEPGVDDDLIEEPAAETEAVLENLAQAVQEAERTVAEEIASWTPDPAAEAASAEETLAAQIAEDKALEAELAAEQAAAEAAAAMDPELLAALPSRDVAEVQSCIETLLFMTDKPMSVAKLRENLGPDFPEELFESAIAALTERYQAPCHGIELVQINGGYQLRTKPGRAALAKKLAKVQTQRLSSGAMETLAIVAYRQPVLKEDIDKVRGVDSSYFIRALLDRKLISICGRSDLPGRPLQYGTTDEFLSLFNLADLAAMPSLRELEQMIPASQSGNAEDEDPKVKEMRRLVGQMKADNSTQLKYDPREDDKILREIRERVQSIPTSTPYLDEQKALEKQAAEAAKQGSEPQIEQPELPAEAAPADEAPTAEVVASQDASTVASEGTDQL